MNEETVPIPTRVVPTVHTELHDKVDHRAFESRRNENDNLIAREVRSAVKELITNELTTIVEESLEDMLQALLHNAQSGIPSISYNVSEQVMVDLIRKQFIPDTMNAHVANYFNMDVAADKLSKGWLTSGSFRALIAALVRRKLYLVMDEKKCIVAYSSMEPMDTSKTFNDDSKSASRWSGSEVRKYHVGSCLNSARNSGTVSEEAKT